MTGVVHEDALADELARLERIQPYIAYMGRAMGFVWNQLDVDTRGRLMDFVDGSVELDAKVVEWAGEFDVEWEQLVAKIQTSADFVAEISDFTDRKIKALLAEARLTQ